MFSAWTLLFFSISTNQEYYTFPVWPPLFILIAAVVAGIEENRATNGAPPHAASLLSAPWLTGAQAVFFVVGVLSAIVLGWGLWVSRQLPYSPDIGTLLAHRGVGDYTLSMSHLFDLTGASFAALRLPAALAAQPCSSAPPRVCCCASKRNTWPRPSAWPSPSPSSSSPPTSPSSASRPCSSSKPMADTIIAKGSRSDTFIIYGEQSSGSSVIFYTHNFFQRRPDAAGAPALRPARRGRALLWGSCYPDAPDIDISEDQLTKMWGTGERKWIFAEDPDQTKVEQLLAGPPLPRPIPRRQDPLDRPAVIVRPL